MYPWPESLDSLKFTIEEEDFSSRSIDLEIHIEFSVQRDRI